MFARVSKFEGFSGDQVDEAVRVAREQFVPAAQQSGGFEGMYVLADRESGTALSITLWERREAMQASEEQADSSRRRSLMGFTSAQIGFSVPWFIGSSLPGVAML